MESLATPAQTDYLTSLLAQASETRQLVFDIRFTEAIPVEMTKSEASARIGCLTGQMLPGKYTNRWLDTCASLQRAGTLEAASTSLHRNWPAERMDTAIEKGLFYRLDRPAQLLLDAAFGLAARGDKDAQAVIDTFRTYLPEGK